MNKSNNRNQHETCCKQALLIIRMAGLINWFLYDLNKIPFVNYSEHHLNNRQKVSTIQTTVQIADHLVSDCSIFWPKYGKCLRVFFWNGSHAISL